MAAIEQGKPLIDIVKPYMLPASAEFWFVTGIQLFQILFGKAGAVIQHKQLQSGFPLLELLFRRWGNAYALLSHPRVL